ncbi:MAG: hypothetical protein ACI9VR_003428 [Cognaticolwellia sp.]
MLLLLACLTPDAPQEAALATSDLSLPQGYHVASTQDQSGPWVNRLANADSPYLQQHADNPVDWREWGDEAFEEARARNLPVFLSVGYAACHWCHVMAHESFEDPGIAAQLNEHFIPIKVDREERPDVDAVYMDAVVMLSGHGGWPASLFLTADGVPFFAGTYYPPVPASGRPSFGQVLDQIQGIWTQQQPKVEEVTAQIQARLAAQAAPPAGDLPSADVGEATLAGMRKGWDRQNSGWSGGGQPSKFPMPSRLLAILSLGQLRDDASTLSLAQQMLSAMDQGGVHDPLGGGFHRYSVDPAWTVPHFEKMLYDNAQLLQVYAVGNVVLGDARYGQVARDTADYMIRDMQAPSGAFWASEDADSGGEEGTFYVWNPAQVRALLPEDQAEAFIAAYQVSEDGNFEAPHGQESGFTVLNRAGNQDPESGLLPQARTRLYGARLERIPPPTDTKLVVAWNGLAISGLSTAARLLDEPAYLRAAQAAANDVLAHRSEDGALPRTLAKDPPTGTLDDYSAMALGLLDLYQADPDPRWLLEAESITQELLNRFSSTEGGFAQAESSAGLIVVRQDATDGAEPSGWGQTMQVLLRLRAYGSHVASSERIDAGFAAAGGLLNQAPWVGSTLSSAYALSQQPSMEVVIAVSDPQDPMLPYFLQAYNAAWRPGVVLAVHTQDPRLEAFAALSAKTPGAEGPRVYVCVDKACGLPTTEVSTFVTQLERGLK